MHPVSWTVRAGSQCTQNIAAGRKAERAYRDLERYSGVGPSCKAKPVAIVRACIGMVQNLELPQNSKQTEARTEAFLAPLRMIPRMVQSMS